MNRDFNARQAIREWTVERVTLVLDNDESMSARLTEAAQNAVRDDMGTGVGREDYDAMLRGRGGNGYDRSDYAAVAGLAVVEVIGEWLDEYPDSLPMQLLKEVIDLTDSAQRDMFGEHYLPEDIDDVDWPEDDESEDDDQ